MIVEIQHETCLGYSRPVTELLAEFRMEPASDENQSCRSFHLTITPSAEVCRYQDGFANRVHHFNILAPCSQLRVVAASVVETHPVVAPLGECAATYPLDSQRFEPDAYDYLTLRGPLRRSPKFDEVLDRLVPQPGQRVGQFVVDVAGYICSNFEYARDVTLASSPIDDLLSHRKGVCQDFTHLMIAVLRERGIPARYVSGYIHRADKHSQSHAWCEVWLPDVGWRGIDPTNNTEIDETFIKVAVGRDFTDVTPNKGVYHGRADEEMFVRVETRALARLPSLSWQETLPPFEVPLTAVLLSTRQYLADLHDVHSHQQQQ